MKIHNIIFLALTTVFIFGNLGCAHNTAHEHTITDYKQECDRLMSKSCNKLGDIYFKGVDAERNLNLAKKYHEKACDLSNSDSCNTLGEWYLFPQPYHIDGLKHDPAKAKELFEIGCKNMNGKSCANLGRIYSEGLWTEKDVDTGDMYLGKACDLYKDGYACEKRAHMFSSGLNRPVDKDMARKYERAAVKNYKAACDKDDGAECGQLGYFYLYKKNYEEAYSYAKRACILNDKYGCNLAGLIDKIEHYDYSIAISYYDKACSLYYEYASADLGYMYENGKGIQKDKRKAKAYYKLACDMVKEGWNPSHCEKVEELTDQGY